MASIFDPTIPATQSRIQSEPIRSNFIALNDRTNQLTPTATLPSSTTVNIGIGDKVYFEDNTYIPFAGGTLNLGDPTVGVSAFNVSGNYKEIIVFYADNAGSGILGFLEGAEESTPVRNTQNLINNINLQYQANSAGASTPVAISPAPPLQATSSPLFGTILICSILVQNNGTTGGRGQILPFADIDIVDLRPFMERGGGLIALQNHINAPSLAQAHPNAVISNSILQAFYSFITTNSSGTPIGTPALGTARNYAVLASSTITNTGSTVITGSLGLSPGTSVTGFPPGTVSGSKDIANSNASTAQASALSTYNALHAMSAGTTISTLDGLILSPGTYTSATSMSLATSGNATLTLNGLGTYVFQIGSTLTTGAGGTPTITLTNGARASDIYWVVGSSATLNSGFSGTFYGNVLAYSSITVTSGGTINGTLAALNGAVTLSAATTLNAVALVTTSSSNQIQITANTTGLFNVGDYIRISTTVVAFAAINEFTVFQTAMIVAINATSNTLTLDRPLTVSVGQIVIRGTITIDKMAYELTQEIARVSGLVTVTYNPTLQTTTYAIGNATISDAQVASTAAIQGIKIIPNFGAQNIVTTGSITTSSAVSTTSSISATNSITAGTSLSAGTSVSVGTTLTVGTGLTITGFSTAGVIHNNASGVFSSSLIVDADVSATAAIARTKLASGTANYVVVNNGSGVMSQQQYLNISQGGTGLIAPGSAGQVLGVSSSGTTLEYKSILGSSANQIIVTATTGYAVLASSTITNSGATVITGNVGLSPGTSITGFSPGTISGTEDINNSNASTALAAAQVAYNTFVADPAGTTISVLDGQTLTPGTYTSATSMSLATSANATLTLNGTGTYIFQIGTTLTTGAGGTPTIVLENGATAADIYWVVGSSATINSGHSGTFYGNVLAHSSITITSGGTVNGTLAALNGAVTISAATAITSTASTGITISTPQNINTTSSPTFAGLTVTGLNGIGHYVGGVLSASLIVDADVSATAAITRTKLASGTASYVVVNDSVTGLLSQEQFLTVTQGGTGTNTFLSPSGSDQYVAAVNGTSAFTSLRASSSTDILSTLVLRDNTGSFLAGTVTATTFVGTLSGNATGSANSFTSALGGDVTGTQTSTVVSSVGGKSAASIAASVVATTAATSSDTPSTIVARDTNGNFSTGAISFAQDITVASTVLNATATSVFYRTITSDTTFTTSGMVNGQIIYLAVANTDVSDHHVTLPNASNVLEAYALVAAGKTRLFIIAQVNNILVPGDGYN